MKGGLQAVLIVATGMVIGTVAGFFVGGHYDRLGTGFITLTGGLWGAGLGGLIGGVVAFIFRHHDYMH